MILNQLRGTTVALVTPFLPGGEVDETGLRELVEWQIQAGTDAVLVLGTTGESVTLTSEERRRVIQIAVKQASGRRPVIAGTGTNSTSASIEYTQQAQELGCDAVLAVGPYYNKPTQSGFYEHFRAIAAATILPVILYNVPGRTGANITAETTLRLAAIDNVIAVKEASGDLSQISRIIAGRPDSFLVLAGDDSITLPLIALGGDGVVSVVANEVPQEFHRMVHCLLEGQWDDGRKLHYKLLDLMEINFVESNPIPVKTALAMMGRIQEVFRLPLVPISNQNRAALKKVLIDLSLIGESK